MTNLYFFVKLNKSCTATDRGTPLHLPGKEKDPQPDIKCTDEILISYVNSAKNSLVIVMRLYFLVVCV